MKANNILSRTPAPICADMNGTVTSRVTNKTGKLANLSFSMMSDTNKQVDLNDNFEIFTPTRLAKLDEKMHFLEGVIPQMYWMTTKAKKRIANSFTEKFFLPDQVMIKEGDKPNNLMVIWEGECVFYSSKNPMQY